MSAPDHVSPYQLSMLMPARELYHTPSLDTAGFGGDVGRMRASKRRTNAMSKLSDVSEGIRKPVQLVHGDDPNWSRFMSDEQLGPAATAVANGNHRLIAAYDENPDMEVPVEHYDTGRKLFDAMHKQDEGDW
jgi:hypothetical protein